jgi:hypothetical protein
VGHHGDRTGRERGVERIGPVAGERGAGRLVLAVDRLGGGARRAGEVVGRRERGGEHALDGPAEVARRRPGARQHGRAALERVDGGGPRDLHRQPVRGRDADQRRAAHGEPADRGGRVLGSRERQHDLLGRQPRLVEHAKGGAVPAEGRCGVGERHRARC